mmetsp:Transcript_66241/g.209401  ORF Transcript_66241/g.209401 Transcript_66241/m.209401 type:complete len:255 (+) Transcript_66241:1353-2117(+)
MKSLNAKTRSRGGVGAAPCLATLGMVLASPLNVCAPSTTPPPPPPRRREVLLAPTHRGHRGGKVRVGKLKLQLHPVTWYVRFHSLIQRFKPHARLHRCPGSLRGLGLPHGQGSEEAKGRHPGGEERRQALQQRGTPDVGGPATQGCSLLPLTPNAPRLTWVAIPGVLPPPQARAGRRSQDAHSRGGAGGLRGRGGDGPAALAGVWVPGLPPQVQPRRRGSSALCHHRVAAGVLRGRRRVQGGRPHPHVLDGVRQ